MTLKNIKHLLFDVTMHHSCMRNLFGHYHQPTARFDERALGMELDMASLAKRQKDRQETNTRPVR
jgi:hypothetical protein